MTDDFPGRGPSGPGLGRIGREAPRSDVNVTSVTPNWPRVTPRIETADTDLPDQTWEVLKANGHMYPADCPRWSAGPIVGRSTSPLDNNLLPHIVLVCQCGVIAMQRIDV